ncbi:TolC family protein [Roseisolibacter sp. H3M3-2]|uniref:TolC family protein n=1 Tax=Roseisolibacter sp. H3M3-2 TaxID=3031323 RepID=UPI0023DA4968|nr:TolC family protein [Roseisolibacter sp. H3M3-2]MDF1502662.1 TolC family protein [Roseisolibacter sp. H3M3-2]
MRLPLLVAAAGLAATPALPVPPLGAQAPAAPATAASPSLSLEEAIGLARSNNPTYQQAVNNRRRAGAQVRAAYGNLLPNVGTNFSTQYREGRQQFFAGQAFGAQADQLNSSVSVGADVTYNVASLTAPRLQRANQEAVEADITGSEQQLRTAVTQQYLLALQQSARAQLQDTLVATAQSQLELARARVAVGAATVLDVRRAEVALGQAQVAGIQARNQAEVEKLRLFQQLGVAQPDNVQLTTRFQVADVAVELPALLEQARRANPTLNALRTREDVASLNVRSAKGDYLPTLQLNAGVSGFGNQFTNTNGLVSSALSNKVGQCAQTVAIRNIATGQTTDPDVACGGIALTQTEIARARAGNGSLYDLTRNPYSVTATLSFPIFNGFTREQRVQEAQANRNDAAYRVRAQELQLVADVTGAFRTLTAQRQTVALQEQSAATAREALSLAQERYRVGAGTFIDVATARDEYARAQTDYVNAVYEYHRAFAALENAVGRPLR